MDYGTITFDGVEISLSQEAYCNNACQYLVEGTDAQGNIYVVEWETTKAWDDAQEDARRGDCSAWAEDESNACDWDDPINIRRIGSVE